MENTTFEHNKHGCHLDTAKENDVLIYLVSFLGSLAVLPGNIISALYMEKIGRVKIIGKLWKFVCKGVRNAVKEYYVYLSYFRTICNVVELVFCVVFIAFLKVSESFKGASWLNKGNNKVF